MRYLEGAWYTLGIRLLCKAHSERLFAITDSLSLFRGSLKGIGGELAELRGVAKAEAAVAHALRFVVK